MKQYAPYFILLILSILLWDAMFDGAAWSYAIDDESFDGPLGGLAAILMAGGGLLIGTVVSVIVAAVLAVVFAGVGVLLVMVLVLAAVVAIVAVSPLMLPLLIPVAIIWYLAKRNRSLLPEVKTAPV